MAVDMFLKLEGDAYKGESRDKVWGAPGKAAIDVLAWSWGMSNSGTAHMGGGAGAGKVNMQDLSLTKYVDASSAALQLACSKGTHIPTATLVVRKAGGTPVEYIVITMNEVLITAVSTGGSGGEDRLTENVTLNFAKVKFAYTEQDPTGKPKTPAKEYTFNIAENNDA